MGEAHIKNYFFQSNFKAIESGFNYSSFCEFFSQIYESIAEIAASGVKSKSILLDF